MTPERRKMLEDDGMHHGFTTRNQINAVHPGYVVIPNVLDQRTLSLCDQYLDLFLSAEGWNDSSYTYMQGPGGTRAVVTKAGWTKVYVTPMHCLLASHPSISALAAETIGTRALASNFYDMKLCFDRGDLGFMMGKEPARKRGWEFSHTDINYWAADILTKLGHKFDGFYQFMVPIRQGQPGLALAKVMGFLCHFLY